LNIMQDYFIIYGMKEIDPRESQGREAEPDTETLRAINEALANALKDARKTKDD
jgi:hypothetical protein